MGECGGGYRVAVCLVLCSRGTSSVEVGVGRGLLV